MQDFEPSQGGVVRWVASQSTNPALQALMREAERDRRTRPSTPVDEPMPWTYPLTSASSVWHSSSTDIPPPSGCNSSASSSSLAPRASEPCVSRRAQPLSTAQRRPLASSVNQPPRHSARPRSSSHSTALCKPFTSKGKYVPQDDEPEAQEFVELLKVTSRRVDKNSELKEQKVRAEGKQKEREQSLEKSANDSRTPGSDIDHANTRPLTKSTSASVVYPITSSAKAPDQTLTKSLSAYKPEYRGRTIAKESSFGVSSVHSVSGKSAPASLPRPNLSCDPKPVLAPRLPLGTPDFSNSNRATARMASFPDSASHDGDTAMQDIIDLTESDTDREKPVSGPISRADTAMCMDLDAEESDSGMDISFYKPEPPPRARASAAPKPKPQPPPQSAAPRPAVPTQRARTGPPPLGMRRAPQLQSSQYTSTQGSNSKGASLPRFKPPLLTNPGGTTDRNGSGRGTKPATSSNARPPPRNDVPKMPVAESLQATPRDPDSSFDLSFDVDVDALEEAMKAYD